MSQLGAALAGQAKYADAERMLIEGFEGLVAREKQISPRSKKELAIACERIVSCFDTWGKPAAAAKWRERLVTIAQKKQ